MSKGAYRAYRKKHVKLWQASGLSKADYATQINVSKEAMRDWVRDFGSITVSQTAPVNPKQTQAATLIPVRIAPTQLSNGLKLTRPDGIVLEWIEPPSAAWLAELLRGLA